MNIKHRKNVTAPDEIRQHKRDLSRLKRNPEKKYLDFSNIHKQFEKSIYHRVQKKILNPGTLGNQLKPDAQSRTKSQGARFRPPTKEPKLPKLVNYGETRAQKLKRSYRTKSQPMVEPLHIQIQPPHKMLLFDKRSRSLDSKYSKNSLERQNGLPTTAGSGKKRYKIDPRTAYH